MTPKFTQIDPKNPVGQVIETVPDGGGAGENHFHPARHDKNVRVVKIDTNSKPQVRDFAYNQITRAGAGDYAAVKAKYGSLFKGGDDETGPVPVKSSGPAGKGGQAEPEGRAKTPAELAKSKHFSLSPLLRGPLAIENEEKRIVEEKAQNRLKELVETALPISKQEGYESGLKRGQAEAFAKFQEEGLKKLERLERLVTDFEAAKEALLRANERLLTEMVFGIAKTLALKEISTDKEHVVRTLSLVLDRVGGKDHIRIKVHPRDLESLAQIRAEIAVKLGDMKNIRVDPDPTLENGGCRVETEWSAVDAAVDTQVANFRTALFGAPEPEKSE